MKNLMLCLAFVGMVLISIEAVYRSNSDTSDVISTAQFEVTDIVCFPPEDTRAVVTEVEVVHGTLAYRVSYMTAAGLRETRIDAKYAHACPE